MRRVTFLLLLLSLSLDATAQVALKEQELTRVRAEIRDLSAALAKKTRQRTRLHDELARAEARLGTARERVGTTDQELAATRERLATIKREEAEERQALGAERSFLGAQMRAAYVAGRGERLRLLLNQEDPAELGRRATYYRYLNAYRQENIERVNQEIARLLRFRVAAEAAEKELAALAERRRKELAEEQAGVAERQALLVRLTDEIAAEDGAIAELRRREQDLDRLVAELNGILEDYPISTEQPFANMRGKLTWPVAGRRLHDFGQPREGSEIRWSGVVLAAERGTEVRAIYHGRVAYADWLPRLGLLLVLDHGDGFLSLYGHNDTLVRSVGDWVGAGDVVATVGDSGGQAETALYVELRRGQEPLNPNRWISRKPRQ